MAERRMFARKIVESAKFLKMPPSSQNLYFHLGINADDDGIVEAYSVMNLVKANEDDLRILLGKGFIEILNEDLVSFIVDWRENNFLRADRKIDSIYKDLLLQKKPNVKLLEKKERADLKKKTEEILDVESGPSTDVQWTAQYSVVENRIEQNSSEECKAVLGKEKITLKEYNTLVNQYSKDLVDLVIERIVKHPYKNCLNVSVISKWCQEAQKRRDNGSGTCKKNGFHNFEQRDYDFNALEKRLLEKRMLGSTV